MSCIHDLHQAKCRHSPAIERGFVVSGVSMARYHVCACIGCAAHEGSCPELTQARHCEGCAQQREQVRGSRQARGYDREHDRLRAQWKPTTDAGLVDCHAVTCLEPQRRIWLGTQWDLGHTDDRTAWTGPEHRRCNRAAGGRASHAHPG